MRLASPIVLLALLLWGCEDAFDPFEEGEARIALFGFLDARQDTQFVRAQPVADRRRAPRLGEVTLTSQVLGSAAVRVWEDSLVTLDDGSVGLLLFAAFRPGPDEVFRLEAEGPAGASEVVEVAMPTAPAVTVSDPVRGGEAISQAVQLRTDLPPKGPEVVYTVRLAEGGGVAEVRVHVNALPLAEGGGFGVSVGLSRDTVVVRRALGLEPEDEREPALLGVRLEYLLEDPERAVLEGGLGAVGVAAAFEHGWTLPPDVVEALGYVDAQGGG